MKNFQQFAINQEEANHINGGTTKKEAREIMDKLISFAEEFDELNLPPNLLEDIRPAVQDNFEIITDYFPNAIKRFSRIDSQNDFDFVAYMSR